MEKSGAGGDAFRVRLLLPRPAPSPPISYTLLTCRRASSERREALIAGEYAEIIGENRPDFPSDGIADLVMAIDFNDGKLLAQVASEYHYYCETVWASCSYSSSSFSLRLDGQFYEI